MKERDLSLAVISDHAAFEMKRRGLSESTVRRVLTFPEERISVRPGRLVLQSRVALDSPEKLFLVRVFVDVDRESPEVVTTYRTSRISRYWRGES